MLIHSIKPRLRKIKQVTKSFVSLRFSTSSNNTINLSYYLNILKLEKSWDIMVMDMRMNKVTCVSQKKKNMHIYIYI
jgi:hypothetical protein